ncbi:hypothetical protein PTE30175_04411 [Pandoraea terrae]|uniref:Uncharacterized protein n=1 Tax=Pandoraea terrae TaxID=1537710 RepID=A0A5E4YGS6_9BURK|nr:hypothetical protein PTE30175_04411 [Pandoraea terrae]
MSELNALKPGWRQMKFSDLGNAGIIKGVRRNQM